MLRKLRITIWLLVFSLFATTWGFWAFEHNVNQQIHSFGDVLWWWIVSSTTVGYGDIYPITAGGRIAGVLTMLTGIYCLTTFVAVMAESLHDFTNRERFGNSPYTGTDHIVICDYTAFADEMIHVLGDYPELAKRKAVMVTDLVAVRPYPHVHFVRGVPISPMALKSANIQEAKYIFVFANIRFIDPDLKTLHCVHRILKLAPKATVYMELNEPEHELAWHFGDRVKVLKSRDMLHSILKGGGLDLSAHFERTAKPTAS